MRVLLIVNPRASSVRHQTTAEARTVLAADHDVEVRETRHRNHATELAAGATAEGFELVVVHGGDGTLNEAANGMVDPRGALAPLPGGSTNVFARAVGYPNDPVAAARLLRTLLDRPRPVRPIGVGRANDRRFLFHVGLGFDAAVVERVERQASMKRRLGQSWFIYCAFATWLRRYDRSGPRFRTEGPDGRRCDDARFGMCLNIDPYTYLGRRPLSLAPGTDLDHGLTMVQVSTMAAPALVALAASGLSSGERISRSRAVARWSAVDAVRVVALAGPLPHQVDGDYVGTADEIRITHEPGALSMVLPRKAD